MAKILVTGSTGFIGKRLTCQLLEQGHDVYALARIKGLPPGIPADPHLHVIYGDLRDPEHIEPLPQDLDAAYYLVHSMAGPVHDLINAEQDVARNFLSVLANTSCKHVIYLGGIIEDAADLSPHLRSRLTVENVLKAGPVPCTILRSSIIIGAGSASFEIIRDLVEKLPVMIAPRWVNSYCQPISISDVLYYLTSVLLQPRCFAHTYDIGGPQAITFRDVLLRYAAFRKLKRYIINVPVLTPKLSSYWLVFITPVRFSICAHLVESMKQHTRKLNFAIDEILPHPCMSYEDALQLAFQKIDQNEVVSTWMDSWDLKKLNADIQEYVEVPQEGCLKDSRTLPISLPLEEVQRRIWSLGGAQGWYALNWAWRLRGLVDKVAGGAGLNRGRRHPTELEPGDSIDFWRVLRADKKEGRLILYAEMKLPGEAWLDFSINQQDMTLTQTATFRPKGLLGRLYWYALVPFHGYIFSNMAKSLAQKPS